MKKVIQNPTGFQTVDSNNVNDLKYFNEEELTMKFCEDCENYKKKEETK